MSSTTSPETGFFASPQRQRWLMWISGAVLVVGIAVFLGVFLSRGGSSGPVSHDVAKVGSKPSSTKPAAKSQKVVAPSLDAIKVARRFVETAVLRQNLDASYPLVGPDLKGGMSLAQWRKGSIPVQPFPAINAKTARFTVLTSSKSELRLVVGPLVARKGSGVRPLAFYLNVDRIGGKWLVNYFLPDYHPGVRANPNY
jgi:hypothetical protein